jgi:hypothetical protein
MWIRIPLSLWCGSGSFSQILSPWMGNIVDSGVGLSDSPCSLAGRYDNPMPLSTISPSQATGYWSSSKWCQSAASGLQILHGSILSLHASIGQASTDPCGCGSMRIGSAATEVGMWLETLTSFHILCFRKSFQCECEEGWSGKGGHFQSKRKVSWKPQKSYKILQSKIFLSM